MEQQTIRTAGKISDAGKVEINYSSPLTKLIQEAGRWCRYYASDLFLWWNSMLKALAADRGSASYLFGFRESGVDSADEIIRQYQSAGYLMGDRYRAIWRLDVEVNEDGRRVEMFLYEVHR
ncbi:hypothetical protein F3B56_27975 [Bacteroides ovatus]|nr:hypothetical protein F3B56_27975 [Bacteroides ovatus]